MMMISESHLNKEDYWLVNYKLTDYLVADLANLEELIIK